MTRERVFNSLTWEDSDGVWHASVPLSERRAEARAAKEAIRAYVGRVVQVEYERFTGHGTVVYRAKS